jgi:hypothetical protein
VGARSGWSDFENHCDYLRICGGVAWPSKGRPGFVVLIGEQARNLRSNDPAVFCGLAESKHRTDDDLLSKCTEWGRVVDAWYSNIIPQTACFSLHGFNQAQRRKGLGLIQVLNIPMLSDAGDAQQFFSYADAEIHKRLLSGQKTVFLGECPKIQAALQNVPEGWSSAEDILKVPEAAALYYVLGAMFCYPSIPRTNKPAFALTEYDPLEGPGKPTQNQAKTDYDPFK